MAPAKTSDAEIVAATRRLIEKHGRDGFSLTDVADAVGIRAPSLYKRFANRSALIAAVEVELWRSLGENLQRALRDVVEPVAQLTVIAHEYRAFANAHPKLYALYGVAGERTEEGQRAREQGAAIALRAFETLVGKRDALVSLRVFVPFIHGFISMELADGFRMGPGSDAAFELGIATILAGLRKRKKT
ncbi:MAG TPA: TetR/AcrR family transcriptional regulator [Kofleriaceae bacterium]